MSDAAAPPHAAGGAGRRDLVVRTLTAAAGVPIVLLLIVAGGPAYTAVVAILLVVATGELYSAAGLRLTDIAALPGLAAAAALAVAAHDHADLQLGILSALVALSLTVTVARGQVADGFRRWAAMVAAPAYVGVLGSHLVALRLLEGGRAWVLLAILTTFATDTGAFVVGRAFGRRRLAPRVSPSKTVAGAVGGLAAGAVAAAALNALLGLDRSAPAMAALGLLAAAAAELGDLAESLIKRSLGVKDMGRLFPGHGGVLDRLDSVLFVVPVLYYVVRWVI